jgi:hypothetical protein
MGGEQESGPSSGKLLGIKQQRDSKGTVELYKESYPSVGYFYTGKETLMTLAHMLGIIGIGPAELVMCLLIFGVIASLTLFWIWMLVDCARRISSGDTRQVGWLIAIALTQVIGAAAYFFFGRNTHSSFNC